MSKTEVARYDDTEEAYHVVNELVHFGIPRENISLVAGDESHERGKLLRPGEDFPAEPPVDLSIYDKAYEVDVSAPKDTQPKAVRGLAMGTIAGGLSGLLLGLAALVFPGAGPVNITTALIAAVTGAVIGALTGLVIGGMMDARVTEERTVRYGEVGAQRGGIRVVVTLEDEELLEQAVEIMYFHQPVDLEQRASALAREEPNS